MAPSTPKAEEKTERSIWGRSASGGIRARTSAHRPLEPPGMRSALWTTGRPYLHCSQRALGFYLYHYVGAYFSGFTPQPPGRRGPMSRYLPQTLVPSRCPSELESGGLGLSPPSPGLTSHSTNGFISLGLPTHLPELCIPGGPEVKTSSISINPLSGRKNRDVGVSVQCPITSHKDNVLSFSTRRLCWPHAEHPILHRSHQSELSFQ
ncbi:uncharacterized protein LOC123929202 [Meles meles]|uniref:uncharacterized protein LOC123929202 n=1 Tax=Meles meles TaxID=9662 RepID=UPI001E69DF44|nr:uncharacterized protein LOC123929202 [Meles meles]